MSIRTTSSGQGRSCRTSRSSSATPSSTEALGARGEFYRQRLIDLLGEDRTGPVVYPTMRVADTAEIDLGDRRLTFTAHGPAHTTSDLSMIDSASGLLFPADLLFVNRIPSLDGSLRGWLKEAERLKRHGRDPRGAGPRARGGGPRPGARRPRPAT